MTVSSPYWTLRITCAAAQIPLLEEAFADDSCAFSTLKGAKDGEEIAEVLFDFEPVKDYIEARLKPFQSSDALLSFELIALGSLDWIKEVSGHLEPMEIGRWTVFGAAFRDQAAGKPCALQIDATSAFGTGEHPTTRGCLLRLDALLSQHPETKDWRMLDVGCGSGILAMAFAKATRGKAFGVDMESSSIAIAKENIANNNLTDIVQFEVGCGYAHPIVAANAPYDLIMANIFADALCDLAPDLSRHLKPGGTAILSGLLNHQVDAVVQAHMAHGLTFIDRQIDGEWSILTFMSRD